MADVDLDQAGELLLSQIRQPGGGNPVVVVAHSMGGTVLTRAAQLAPELIGHAVYVAALMPASGVPAGVYARLPENDGSLVPSLTVADPRAVRAVRLDVASPDPAYREREAFCADADPAAAAAAIARCASWTRRIHRACPSRTRWRM